MPVAEIGKVAETRCPYQRHGKGCVIYQSRPPSCRLWSCLWLTDDATAGLSRPDRSHYVLDPMPDFVTATADDGSPVVKVPVLQIWIDQAYPDAHRDPALRAMLEANCVAAIVRPLRILLCPPSLNSEAEWREMEMQSEGCEHTSSQIFEVIGERGLRLS
jgi:hypothetical protein